MKLKILASSHYCESVSRVDPPRPLDADLAAVCRERYRRVDRFVQLALLGSARAAQGSSLSPRCGLYLHSGIGPVGNNAEVQQQLFRDHQLPKPVQFVNTLGSSSLYFTAKNLGLEGPALFVSRRRVGLLAPLQLALADLACGAVDQALIGAVEECPRPVDDQCIRVRLPLGTPMAEASEWLLLAPGEGPGPSLELGYHPDLPSLLTALRDQAQPGDRLAPGFSLSAEENQQLHQQSGLASAGPETQAWHDSLDASALCDYLGQKKPGGLWLAARGGNKGFALMKIKL